MSTASDIFRELSSTPIGSIFRPARILIADDEVLAREILARKLTGLGYVCECCESGQSALNLLAGKSFDLLLVDVLMPEIGGVALLKEVLAIRPDIAVILVTPVIDIQVAVEALKYGAYDYITKPFSPEEVSISVSRALEKRRLLLENQNYQHTLEEQVASRTYQLEQALDVLEQTYHSTLVALSKALDSRDAGSDGRSLRVTIYSTRLAQQLGMSESDIRIIEQGVLLHDIGNIGIPDKLLRNPGELDENEWLLWRKHPEIGYRILSRIKFLTGAAQLVLHHHERYNGKGFSQGLKGEEINLGARIFAVADEFETLTSKHSFPTAAGFKAIRREIKAISGAQLDPMIVDTFLKIPFSEWNEIYQQVAANAGSPDFRRGGAHWHSD